MTPTEKISIAAWLMTSLAVVNMMSGGLIHHEDSTAGASTAATAADQHSSAEREYCQWDVFDASCESGATAGDHRVIVMRTARYGLMKVGRCVAKNYGFVGCSTDVLGHMDSLCSGRRRCRFTVPDETMRAMLPCPKEFSPYLEASYQCVTVATSTSGHCSPNRRRALPLVVETGVERYLASSVTDATGHGSSECPWLLQAAPGQRISVTLLEFDSSTPHAAVASGGGGARGQSSTSGSRQPGVGPSSTENEVDRQHQHHYNHADHPLHRGASGCVLQLAIIREHPTGFGASAAKTSTSGTSSAQASSSSSAAATTTSGWETVVCSSSTASRVGVVGSGGEASMYQREKTIYLSTSNELEVMITRPQTHSFGSKSSTMHTTGGGVTQLPTFLLRYEAVGCATPPTPTNGWLQRTGNDVITSGCNETRERAPPIGGGRRHVMHCEGTRWIGEMANCTSSSSSISASAAEPGSLTHSTTGWISLKGEWTSPFGILLVSAIGVIIGLIVGVTLLFIVIFFMKRRTQTCLDITRHAPETEEFVSASSAMMGAAASTTVDFRSDTACSMSSCRCIVGRSPAGASSMSCETECDACAKMELVTLRRDPINPSSTDLISGAPPYGSIWSAAEVPGPDDAIIGTRYGGGVTSTTAAATVSGRGSQASSPLLYGQTAAERNYFTRAHFAGVDPFCSDARVSGLPARRHFYESPKQRLMGAANETGTQLPPDVTSLRYDVRVFQGGSVLNS